jgi:hypothetical protein
MTGPAACDYIVHRELPLAPLPQELQKSVADDDGTAAIGREPAPGNGSVSAPAA